MATSIEIRIRGDTGANWESKNTVLKQREIGYDMTANRFKVGDGLTAWKDLAYVAPDVINDLTTGGNDKALSAEQGKTLKAEVDAKASSTTVNNLQQTLTTLINDSKVTVEDKLDSTSTTNALSANQGKVLKEFVDDITQDITEITQVTETTIKNDDITSETWRFTLDDDSTIEKKVALWSS